MIFIDRESKGGDGQPIRPNAVWFERAGLATSALHERADRLLDTSETPEPLLTELEFEADRKIYAHNQVKIALRDLFHDKCAYCESEVVAVTHLEVEHFRPKARVAERPDHPGYYWLAYEWSNLYLSCKLCNGRYRDQPVRERPTLGKPKGKYDQFPIEGEAERALSHRSEVSSESPVLLDPCRDQPERFLTFGLSGKALSIGEDPRAKATLKILHLNRSGLEKARRKRITEALRIIRIFLKAGRTDLARKATAVYSRPTSPYSAACEAIWRHPTDFGLPDVELEEP